MQVNPGGNRRLNWELHSIALVRLRMDGGRSRQFMAKQTDHGKTKRAALRLMKTYIAREVFKQFANPIVVLAPAPLDKHILGSAWERLRGRWCPGSQVCMRVCVC